MRALFYYPGVDIWLIGKGVAMAKSDISSLFYRLARMSRDVKVLSSGSPKRISRRAKNKFLGRKISKIWKWP